MNREYARIMSNMPMTDQEISRIFIRTNTPAKVRMGQEILFEFGYKWGSGNKNFLKLKGETVLLVVYPTGFIYWTSYPPTEPNPTIIEFENLLEDPQSILYKLAL